MQTLTDEDVSQIAKAIEQHFGPLLKEAATRDFDAALNHRARQLLTTMVGEELRELVRRELQDKVRITVVTEHKP
jgi:hypothetical protein